MKTAALLGQNILAIRIIFSDVWTWDSTLSWEQKNLLSSYYIFNLGEAINTRSTNNKNILTNMYMYTHI